MHIKPCSLAIALLCMPMIATSAPIDIFNTGVDDFNALLGNGIADLHYNITASPPAAGVVPLAQSSGALPGGWVNNGINYQWLSSGAASDPIGTYLYQTDFTLGSGAIINEAFLEGRWTVDNSLGRIFLNGIEVAAAPAPSSNSEFLDLDNPFNITSGFVAGFNTLSFEFINTTLSGSGLLVVFDNTGDRAVSAVPELHVFGLFSLGLLGLYGRPRKIRV